MVKIMRNELVGIVVSKIDKMNGRLIGFDQCNYIFSKSDYLSNFDLEIKDRVLFKPTQIIIGNEVLYKATMISKIEEEI